MTHGEKLAAILASVQTDPGNRGLARDPDDNLFTATAGDFERACLRLSESESGLDIVTGFFISSGRPPAFETDGPLGAAFLLQAFPSLGRQASVTNLLEPCANAILAGLRIGGVNRSHVRHDPSDAPLRSIVQTGRRWPGSEATHTLAIEFSGPAADGRHYSMRGRDITQMNAPLERWALASARTITIGIGDGGNEIGMGKIPHETIVKNIPNGDLIHCRVPTDHLIVAGVSNWGAYALAAGLFVLLNRKPPSDLFDPDRELAILEAMVREGPLVDGVTGQQTATVDGLTWEEYSRPLLDIRCILES